MRRYHCFLQLCLSFLSLITFTSSPSAETNNPAADSRPYLVMGKTGMPEYSKSGGLRSNATRSELDKKDFAKQLFRTTPQALREIPGVMIQETAPGQGSPIIRGFTGYHNLMTVDGIRLNNSVFRSGPN